MLRTKHRAGRVVAALGGLSAALLIGAAPAAAQWNDLPDHTNSYNLDTRHGDYGDDYYDDYYDYYAYDGDYRDPAYAAQGPVFIDGRPAVDDPRLIEAALRATISPYGRWIRIPGIGEVWQPRVSVVGRGFRPYVSNGHWIRSPDGWVFRSDWSWGWAVFHYGRWARVPRYGWVWAPDPRWAPSWTDWRVGDDYVGWAPLPPAGFGLSYRLSPSWWAFVPRRHFVHRHVYDYVLPRRHVGRFFHRTRLLHRYRQHRGYRLHLGPRVASVRRWTNQRIPLYRPSYEHRRRRVAPSRGYYLGAVPHVRQRSTQRYRPGVRRQDRQRQGVRRHATPRQELRLRATPRHDIRGAAPRQNIQRATPRHDIRRATPRQNIRRATPRHDIRRAAPRQNIQRATPRHYMRRAAPRHVTPRQQARTGQMLRRQPRHSAAAPRARRPAARQQRAAPSPRRGGVTSRQGRSSRQASARQSRR